MTTSDFIKKVKTLGFDACRYNRTISIARSGVIVASISIDKWARYDFSSRRLISAGKMPQLTRLIAEYGDTPVEDREEAYYRLYISELSGEHKAYIHGISSDSAVVAFTHDVNLADKVSERGAKDVIIIMDRVHNIEVKKERV